VKFKINQLGEEVNKKNADVTIQQLKKENSQLHQLVNKYRESKNANRISVGTQTEKVASIIIIVSITVKCVIYNVRIFKNGIDMKDKIALLRSK